MSKSGMIWIYVCLVVALSSWATSLRLGATAQQTKQGIICSAIAAAFFGAALPAFAGVDPSLLQQYVKPEDKAAYSKQYLSAPSLAPSDG
jgi:hypothetical protein